MKSQAKNKEISQPLSLTLTTWQRVMITKIIGQLRGPLNVLREGMKLLDALELSAEDKATVGYVELPGGSARWEDVEHTWQIEVEANLMPLLRNQVQDWPDWPLAMLGQVEDFLAQLEPAKEV